MRILLLTSLTMIAFASNSLLNRLALSGGHIDSVTFGSIRLLAGAVTLALICVVLRGDLKLGGPGRISGVVSLLVYIFGFSAAYNALDAGLGALILFGMVQVTMFFSAWKSGEAIHMARWLGLVLAGVGLIWLLWPAGQVQVSVLHGGCMALAGLAWGVYSLVGRKAGDPLQATAANFVLATPIGVLVWLVTQTNYVEMNTTGLGLAVVSGSLTSGLGYALWYAVLPGLKASAAAVAQLSAPVIALVAGVALLGEVLTAQILLASALVLGGVALSSLAGRR